MDHVNQMELHILEEICKFGRLPKFYKTALGKECLDGLVESGYIDKSGEGTKRVYIVTQKGIEQLESEPVEQKEKIMEEENSFKIADEANIWREVLQTSLDNGATVDSAIVNADVVISAYRARAVAIYAEAIKFKKALIDDYEKNLSGVGVQPGADGTIIPKDSN